MSEDARPQIRQLPARSLTTAELAALRTLLWAAFADTDPMTEEDWTRAISGDSFVADIDGEIVAYASVAERELRIAGVPVRTGFVEAVAVALACQGRGTGSALMRRVNSHIADTFDLGGLGTGSHHFYERMGWQTWRGPSAVREPSGLRPTPDEDGYIMVLLTPSSPSLDFAATIDCDARSGDSW